jgi:hypothetical protein
MATLLSAASANGTASDHSEAPAGIVAPAAPAKVSAASVATTIRESTSSPAPAAQAAMCAPTIVTGALPKMLPNPNHRRKKKQVSVKRDNKYP